MSDQRPHPSPCAWCRSLRRVHRTLRSRANHPLYVTNGNEGPTLAQLMTAADTAYYAALLADETRT